MEHILKIIVAIIVGWVGYKWWQHKRYRREADKFKELLVADLPNYESPVTTLGAVVLSHFPQHNEAFKKFLIYVPKKKQQRLIQQWGKYNEIHALFNSAGVFGAVMAELPDPDFEPSQENVEAVSRKRKKQISKILGELIEKL
ncbi:MAG: hypothetical protein OQK98_14480 [Gammaproteobacteria bacterium]|nr:hypothetical protein [Gammaproteobacteria bacterium]